MKSMSKHTLTIELAKPLEWVRVERNSDINKLRDTRAYAIRKDGRGWMAYLNRVGSVGLGQFRTIEPDRKQGPSGHLPFEVALIETPPWPIVHKDKDGWIDLEKTPAGVLHTAISNRCELRGDWEGPAWGFWSIAQQQWIACGTWCNIPLPAPYDKPTRARMVNSWPSEWDKGPPKHPEPETVEQRLARLEAQMKEVSKAAGKGGGE